MGLEARPLAGLTRIARLGFVGGQGARRDAEEANPQQRTGDHGGTLLEA